MGYHLYAKPLHLAQLELEVLSIFSHFPSSGNSKGLNSFPFLSSFRGEKTGMGATSSGPVNWLTGQTRT